MSQGLALVGMARDPALTDLNAVLTGIGAELRRLYSDVLHQELPDRMAELLKQLEQLTEGGHQVCEPRQGPAGPAGPPSQDTDDHGLL
jgi:hypothetical protein